MRPVEARATLSRAAALPQEMDFWGHRDQGLAVFVAPGYFAAYRVPVTLPLNVVTADRFRLRPLLPLLEREFDFYLLTISQNAVALYRATRYYIEQLEVPGLPRNLKRTLNYTSVDRGSQVHSATRGGTTGKQAAVFHGQGGEPDSAKQDLETYSREINRAIVGRLRASTRPLLLGCVDSLAPIYREENTYPHLMRETLAGSHDDESLAVLHAHALRIVEPMVNKQVADVAARYEHQRASERASDDVSGVVLAAVRGRVDQLFYDPQAEVFGTIDLVSDTVSRSGQPDDEDLVDLAAIETLHQGGQLYSMQGLQLSTNSPLAALLRY